MSTRYSGESLPPVHHLRQWPWKGNFVKTLTQGAALMLATAGLVLGTAAVAAVWRTHGPSSWPADRSRRSTWVWTPEGLP